MRKFIVLAVCMLFVFGLAATSYAVHSSIPRDTSSVVASGTTSVVIDGSTRTRLEVNSNLKDFDSDANDSQAKGNGRIRLGISAIVADNASAYIQLEGGTGWGRAGNTGGTYLEGNSQQPAPLVLQAFINYNAGPVGVKIGHMVLVLGNALFFDHTDFGDDAIVISADPSDAVHVAVLTAKFTENSSTSPDDTDVYVGLVNLKLDAVTVSADVTYLDDQDAAPDGLHLINMGARAKANVGPVTVNGDIELQTGTVGAAGGDIDFAGYAATGGVSANLGAVTVSGFLGIGSGDDDPNDDEIGNFQNTINGGADYFGLFLYGPRIGNPNAPGGNQGISNLTIASGKVSANITDTVSVWGQIAYLAATEENAAGNDGIGIEVDGKVTIKLARNLKAWVRGGYLAVDDDNIWGIADPDGAYAVRAGWQLGF